MKIPSLVNRPVEFTASSKVKSVASSQLVRNKYYVDPNIKLLKDYGVNKNFTVNLYSDISLLWFNSS